MPDQQVLPHDWFPSALPACVHLDPTSWLHSSYAFLHSEATRPDAVRIGAHTGVYVDSWFELGPDAEVVIGEYCTVVAAIINTGGRVHIDDFALVSHGVVISDEPAPVPPPERHRFGPRRRATSIRVGRNAWVGAMAILLDGADIGEGSIVGAGAVVSSTIPPYSIAAGNPARVTGSSA
jgi:acetyltransferase-like isoleucine patch superfamily enzyme